MIDFLFYLAAWALGAAVGYAYAAHKNRARNAAHVECVECTHRTGKTALRDAQSAAQAHRAETGHIALVVAKYGPA